MRGELLIQVTNLDDSKTLADRDSHTEKGVQRKPLGALEMPVHFGNGWSKFSFNTCFMAKIHQQQTRRFPFCLNYFKIMKLAESLILKLFSQNLYLRAFSQLNLVLGILIFQGQLSSGNRPVVGAFRLCKRHLVLPAIIFLNCAYFLC